MVRQSLMSCLLAGMGSETKERARLLPGCATHRSQARSTNATAQHLHAKTHESEPAHVSRLPQSVCGPIEPVHGDGTGRFANGEESYNRSARSGHVEKEMRRSLQISDSKFMAERQGFEPWIPCGIHAFQACAFSHSAISPLRLHVNTSDCGLLQGSKARCFCMPYASSYPPSVSLLLAR
jgi:hypothetical protein